MNIHHVSAGRQCEGRLWSSMGDVCELLHVGTPGPISVDPILFQHIQFKEGQRIQRIGQAFNSVYIVRLGFMKTVQMDEVGNEQVLGFPMKGDLLGIDGIHTGQYTSEAVALSDCDLISVPFRKPEDSNHLHGDIEKLVCRMMCRELTNQRALIGMLGTLSAEARVGRFLLSMSERFVKMGYSGKVFNLRMTRQDIGSYLGLTLETVSRTLSAFNEMGLISVRQRLVCINDIDALRTLRKRPVAHARARRSATGRAAPPEQSDSSRECR